MNSGGPAHSFAPHPDAHPPKKCWYHRIAANLPSTFRCRPGPSPAFARRVAPAGNLGCAGSNASMSQEIHPAELVAEALALVHRGAEIGFAEHIGFERVVRDHGGVARV